MRVLEFCFKATSKLIRTTFYLSSLYTFFAYFYVEQIKHRLKDSKNVQAALRTNFIKDPLSDYITLRFCQVIAFYSRAWNYRSYQNVCQEFCKKVIKPVLQNYESFGILQQRKEMEISIEKNQIDPNLLSKILAVKKMNQQFKAIIGAAEPYQQLIEKQSLVITGTILGLSQAQSNDIHLVYLYLYRGQFQKDNAYQQAINEVGQYPFKNVASQFEYI